MKDLAGRTHFVTGASSGIGKAVVEALAARGANVVLACRSEEKTKPVLAALKQAYPDVTVDFVRLDLGDLHQVRRTAEDYLASGKPLDVLINNAGLAGASGLTKDGFEICLGTNHLGPFLLTRLLWPKLKEAKDARMVNVGSRAGTRVKKLTDWDAFTRASTSAGERLGLYGISKLMNTIHANELGRRFLGTVHTSSLHPGVVASDVWRQLPGFVQPLAKLFMITNEEGAKTPVYCATEQGIPTMRYWDKCKQAKMNPLGEDLSLANELFARSEQLIDDALMRNRSN